MPGTEVGTPFDPAARIVVPCAAGLLCERVSCSRSAEVGLCCRLRNSKTGQPRCPARLGKQSPQFRRSLRPDLARRARILWHSIQARLRTPNVERTGYPGVLDIWEFGWPLLRGDDRPSPFRHTRPKVVDDDRDLSTDKDVEPKRITHRSSFPTSRRCSRPCPGRTRDRLLSKPPKPGAAGRYSSQTRRNSPGLSARHPSG